MSIMHHTQLQLFELVVVVCVCGGGDRIHACLCIWPLLVRYASGPWWGDYYHHYYLSTILHNSHIDLS